MQNDKAACVPKQPPPKPHYAQPIALAHLSVTRLTDVRILRGAGVARCYLSCLPRTSRFGRYDWKSTFQIHWKSIGVDSMHTMSPLHERRISFEGESADWP